MLVWQTTNSRPWTTSSSAATEAGPAVLVVEGDVGTGKTALLDELTDRAKDFHILAAEGNETDRKAYDALAQWGVDPPRVGWRSRPPRSTQRADRRAGGDPPDPAAGSTICNGLTRSRSRH